jgi:Fic family protein
MTSEIEFYVPALKGGKAFVPTPPKVIIGIETLMSDLVSCSAILSKLDTLIVRLPDPYLLTENLIFMEAVTSSRIEGTRAGFEELFTNRDVSLEVLEVKNCAEAFRYGPKILESAHSVMDLAKDLHCILMKNHQTVKGEELKKAQNYTIKKDGSIFTYTPPHFLEESIAAFESFTMQDDKKIPELIRQAISHWIFEQIHPFPDGNGRVGRLLIPLLLQYKGIVDTPFALISEAVETQKHIYIEQFERLLETQDWIPWCRFFLSMLHINAHKNINRIEQLESLRLNYQNRTSKKSKGSILPIITQDLFKKPRFTRKELQEIYGLSPRGASILVQEMIDLKIIKSVDSCKQRNVVYEAFEILETVLR